ncbi:GGDEF family protein [Vibrio orientalis CIP 102891 = ATCC 33934]|uniref:diguanylate cyclase n=1 Tax=Vibrio orientalis CIP 102891 = ATCC 33934 TaxID=675816 RepID=C9QGZ5_VIBOR|nr:GGDEF domain-containing protein [Vibrio orientalis]EEX93543.1 GGDEF family protein [Vibrio orientalis CIP 102891 = ATCC 33934]EGU46053.1 GGDEF family protein [Vibrio orientalis CIP 102891 = ATCC 33934]
MLTNGLEKWLGVNRTQEEFRESVFVFASLTVLSSVLSLFICYNTLFIPNLFLASIEAIGLALCSLAYFWLWQSRNVKIAATIMVSVMTSVSLLFIVGSGHSEFALAFSFLTPVVAIFVLGYKVGAVFSLVNFAIIAYICLIDMHNWPPIPFDNISFIHLSIVYLFLFSIAYFYDSGRRKTLALLKESNRQLQALSHTDMLTQLFNRRHMEALLQEPHKVQWLAIVDIDDFKKINDDYGHDVGDQVLIQTARTLERETKSVGQVGRWGGEEFLIAFETADYSIIEERVRAIQTIIASQDFGIERPVTVSSGVAYHQDTGKSDAFRRADEALYQAKNSGKNCFYVAVEAS